MKLIIRRLTKNPQVYIQLEADGVELGELTFPNPQAWGKFHQCFRLGAAEMQDFEFMLVPLEQPAGEDVKSEAERNSASKPS